MVSEEDIHPLILDHLNAVIKLDVEGNLISYNQSFTKQYGYTKQDFKRPFLDVFLKNYTLEQKQYYEQATFGMTQRFNALGCNKNGNVIDINVTLVPITTKNSIDIFVIVKNITDIKDQERKLFYLQQKRDVFDEIEDIGNFHYDVVEDHIYCSKQLKAILGMNEEKNTSLPLKKILQYVHPDDRNQVENILLNAIANKTGYQLEYRVQRKDQTIRYISEQAGIILNEEGRPDCFIGFCQDITDSKSYNNFVLETENQLPQLYNNPDIGFWTLILQTGQTLYCSKGIEHISGFSTHDFNNGTQWSTLVHPGDVEQYRSNQQKLNEGNIIRHQYRIINKSGEIKWVQDYTIPTLDSNGTIIELNGLISDVTETKLLSDKIEYLSDHDDLTKLPNRRKFFEILQQLTGKFAGTNQKFAVMILDMDRFKYINDTLGHQIGDQLLIQIAKRLSKHLTSNDILSRSGGDEFSIIISKMASIDGVKTFANKIMESFQEPFTIQNYQLYVTASIGISTYPENGVSSLELLRNADQALYKAQKGGKNNYKLISPLNNIESYKSFSLGRDLRQAIENNEMRVYYQPRVDMCSNKIIGAEALIRWEHPKWGLISPQEFLTLAEENGLITYIDEWVLKEVCNQIKKWKKDQQYTVPISINITPIHFMKQDWPNTILHVIRESGISPQDLELEMTERSLLDIEEIAKEICIS